MSSIHLKCIIVISNNVHFECKFFVQFYPIEQKINKAEITSIEILKEIEYHV